MIEEVCTLHEVDDRLAISGRVGGIGDIADLLALRDGEDVAKLAERHHATRRSLPFAEPRSDVSSGRFSTTARFSSLQPCPDREPALSKPVLPDVDMRRLFERKGKTRRAMLKDRRRDPKYRLAVDQSLEQRLAPSGSAAKAFFSRNAPSPPSPPHRFR